MTVNVFTLPPELLAWLQSNTTPQPKMTLSPSTLIAERRSICGTCIFKSGDTCGKMSCPTCTIDSMVMWKSGTCPIGKW